MGHRQYPKSVAWLVISLVRFSVSLWLRRSGTLVAALHHAAFTSGRAGPKQEIRTCTRAFTGPRLLRGTYLQTLSTYKAQHSRFYYQLSNTSPLVGVGLGLAALRRV
jgi:hypothetical protein